MHFKLNRVIATLIKHYQNLRTLFGTRWRRDYREIRPKTRTLTDRHNYQHATVHVAVTWLNERRPTETQNVHAKHFFSNSNWKVDDTRHDEWKSIGNSDVYILCLRSFDRSTDAHWRCCNVWRCTKCSAVYIVVVQRITLRSVHVHAVWQRM